MNTTTHCTWSDADIIDPDRLRSKEAFRIAFGEVIGSEDSTRFNNSSVRVTWLIRNICDVTYSSEQRGSSHFAFGEANWSGHSIWFNNSSVCVPWLINMCDMPLPCVGHDSWLFSLHSAGWFHHRRSHAQKKKCKWQKQIMYNVVIQNIDLHICIYECAYPANTNMHVYAFLHWCTYAHMYEYIHLTHIYKSIDIHTCIHEMMHTKIIHAYLEKFHCLVFAGFCCRTT